jgi:hypothetical protein
MNNGSVGHNYQRLLNLFYEYLLPVCHPAKDLKVTGNLTKGIDFTGLSDLFASPYRRSSKKMQDAFPGGQYAISPSFTTS